MMPTVMFCANVYLEKEDNAKIEKHIACILAVYQALNFEIAMQPDEDD